MLKITVVSTKGGVGKTTLTANLGALLADLGQRVLLIDADPQPTLSSYFALAERAPTGLTSLLVEAGTDGVASRTTLHNLDLIYSDDPDGKLRDWIRDAVDGRWRLRHLLGRPWFAERYDIILIDTQGAVGPLQDAAVVAADYLLSPIPPEILSAREFCRGTLGMLERLKPLAYMGAPVGPLYGVIYRQARTGDARRIAAELRSESFAPSGGTITILDTIIPAAVDYTEAATHRLPVHRLPGYNRGAGRPATEAMLDLVRELFPHLESQVDRHFPREEG